MVLVHHERRGLDADRQFVHHLVGLGVDLQDAVLVRPAIDIDVLAVLHHLLRGARFHRHSGALDVARDLVAFGIDDEDAVVPDLRHVGLFVRKEVDVARRGEVRDASHLPEGVDVDGEDDVRIVHHDPAHAVADGHRLRHVAQLEAVGAEENLVLHPFGLGVVIGERGVAVLEISLVGDEQSPPRGRELLRRAVVPLHAAREQHEAACGRECVSYDPFHVPQTVRSVRRRAGGTVGRGDRRTVRSDDPIPTRNPRVQIRTARQVF